jgi:hypothetical protein
LGFCNRLHRTRFPELTVDKDGNHLQWALTDVNILIVLKLSLTLLGGAEYKTLDSEINADIVAQQYLHLSLRTATQLRQNYLTFHQTLRLYLF